MLSSITIRRFKNLTDVTIPMGRINVLVGTNNSGKSSVLQGVALGVSVAQTAHMNGGVATLSPDQLIYAPLRDVSALALGGYLRQRKEQAIEIVFRQVRVADDVETEAESLVQVSRGKNQNLAVSVAGALKSQLQSLDEPYAMYVPGLSGIPAAETYRTPAALRRAAARGDANAVLRNVLWSLRSKDDAWAGFSRNLARVFVDHSVEVTFDPNLDEYVDAKVVSPRGTLPIDAAGTGFLQTVQILAYTSKYKPNLLLLDEPDSHIHPDRQRQLVTLLSELAEENDFQVLVATHSRHLLDGLVKGARFHWMSDGVRVDEDQLDRVRVLTDLGALDSGDLLKAGRVDAVLLTEDTDTLPLQVLLQSSGFDLARTQIWSYSGCTKLDAAIVLAHFIRDHAPGTEILVHRDRDYLGDEEVTRLEQRFSSSRLRLFVTDGTDAESHLVSVEHIRHNYPLVSEDQVQRIIDDATLVGRDESVKTLARKLFEEARNLRRTNGVSGDPDIVAISDDARSRFDGDAARWRHGKKCLGRTIAGLQALLGENPKLIRPSPALVHPTLRAAHQAVKDRRTALANPAQQHPTVAPVEPQPDRIETQKPSP